MREALKGAITAILGVLITVITLTAVGFLHERRRKNRLNVQPENPSEGSASIGRQTTLTKHNEQNND